MKFYFLLFFTFFSLLVNAQKITYSGLVTEAESGETLPGVLIYSSESNAGTTSNNYGFYSLTLPSTDTKIVIQFMGYEPLTLTLDPTSPNKNIQLEKVKFDLKTIVVEGGNSTNVVEETQMSSIEIPIDQIKKIPALFGEKDVLKVIQLLPGVQKGSEGSSGFYVRGGGPDQNLIILDDATVYNANHLFGFFSIFNGDALKSVELIKGGFPARYGGRLSSVLEMQMKDGSKEKFKGEAGVGLISSRLTLEGPIQKGKSSFLVSGRRTYIDALIYPFLPADQKAGYFFYDFNAKANFILNEKNRFYLSGYFGKDKFYFRPKAEDGTINEGYFLWQNQTGTARLNHIISDKSFSNTSLIFSKYNLAIGLKEIQTNNDFFELRFKSGIRDWAIKHDIDFFPNANHHIRTGLSATYHRFTPSAIVVASADIAEELDKAENYDALESGIYLEDDWKITPLLKANIGTRVSHFIYNSTNYYGIEPRASIRYLVNEKLSVKGSYALMNQYMHLLSNTGVGLPTDLWVPATDRVAPQRSHQAAIGIAKDLDKPKLTITAEAYYKSMLNIIGYKEGASFLSVGRAIDGKPITWQDNVTSGQGTSYGAELLVQKKVGKFSGWIGYTLSWTTLQFDELNDGKPFYARYDRRHDFSVVGIYEVNDHLTLSATWVYGTGQAITLPLATYNVQPHDPATNQFNSFFGLGATDYGGKNDFRMAPYHRLDLAAQWHKQLKRAERTFELGIYNAYNRKNPFFYSISQRMDGSNYLSQVSLFPIIPSVSWSYKF